MDVHAWMTRLMVSLGRTAIALACAAVPLVGSAQRVIDLGRASGGAPGSGPVWIDINDIGQVVGYEQWTREVFLFSGGVASVLAIASPGSNVARINNLGQVAGATYDGLAWSAAVYAAGIVQDLGTLGGAYARATAINDRGQVTADVTYRAVPGDDAVTWTRAVLYDGGRVTDLGTLGGASSIAVDVNASGQVTGTSMTADGSGFAYLYSNGVMTSLGALSGTYSHGYALNDRGDVVGHYATHDWARAFVYSAGSMIDLGTLLGGNTFANDINERGQVVGTSYDADPTTAPGHAFLYQNGVMSDLNDLVTGSGWLLSDARAIGDNGDILGYGYLNGDLHTFLLQGVDPGGPVAAIPEPGTFALLGFGLAGMVVVRRRRDRKAAAA